MCCLKEEGKEWNGKHEYSFLTRNICYEQCVKYNLITIIIITTAYNIVYNIVHLRSIITAMWKQ